MSAPGYAHPPGGATSHLPSSARFALAAALLALGLGDLAAIDFLLLPRTFATTSGNRPLASVRPHPAPHPAPLPTPLPATRGEGAERREAGEGPPGETPPAPAPAVEELPDLLFAINTTWLSRTSRETLDRVADKLAGDPTRQVVLSGHTDTLGAPDVNRALARARARRASRYLQAHGVDPGRIETRSFGSTRPRTGESTAADRARDRRVEIAIQ